MTVNQEDFDNAGLDLTTISEVANVNFAGDSTTNREGTVIATLLGQLKQIGYLVPVSYAGSIIFLLGDTTKTIERSGIIYAPNPTDLPFTTTGTWSADDEDKFFTIQGTNVSDGSITPSKLSDIGDAKIYIGQGTGTTEEKAVTGAVSIDKDGLTALTTDSVGTDQIQAEAVTIEEIEILPDASFLLGGTVTGTGTTAENHYAIISGGATVSNTGVLLLESDSVAESMLEPDLRNKLNSGNATNIYRGRVNSGSSPTFDGTFPSGWTVTNTGGTVIRVTHNLGTSDYSVIAICVDGSVPNVVAAIEEFDPNFFDIDCNSTNSIVSEFQAFHFIVAK